MPRTFLPRLWLDEPRPAPSTWPTHQKRPSSRVLRHPTDEQDAADPASRSQWHCRRRTGSSTSNHHAKRTPAMGRVAAARARHRRTRRAVRRDRQGRRDKTRERPDETLDGLPARLEAQNAESLRLVRKPRLDTDGHRLPRDVPWFPKESTPVRDETG